MTTKETFENPYEKRGIKGTLSKLGIILATYSLKVVFFVLNILVLCTGLVITAFSGWLYCQMLNFRLRDAFPNFPLPLATFLFGTLILLLAVCGFSCTGRPHCLVMYSTCLVGIMIAEVLLGLHIYIIYGEGKQTMIIKDVLYELMHSYADDTKSERFVDAIQSDFKCCGVDSSVDWLKTPLRIIPRSCCEGDCHLSLDAVYKKGCSKELEADFQSKQEQCVLLTVFAIPLTSMFILLAIYNALCTSK